MFSPEINPTKTQLASLFNEVTGVTGYSIGVQDTRIGVLPLEPKWLPAVRSEMTLLAQAGATWVMDYPPYWVKIMLPFADYGTDFAAFSKKITTNIKTLTKNEVVALLSALSESISNCISSTSAGLDELTGFENSFTSVFPNMNKSIDDGWKELGDEENEMIAIAEAITQLQDEVASLEADIDVTGISGGESFVQTNVTIAYDIITAVGEVAIPYLSIVSLAFTIGKTFYKIISDSDKINTDIEKIGELQLKASEEAQAAAATKAVIQYLYKIQLQFSTIQKHGQGLVTMWQDEKGKIDEAINAIHAGAEPSAFLDILTMDIANKNWDALLKFSNQIINMPRQTGQAVILKTNKN